MAIEAEQVPLLPFKMAHQENPYEGTRPEAKKRGE
jgi:hypothetical protein